MICPKIWWGRGRVNSTKVGSIWAAHFPNASLTLMNDLFRNQCLRTSDFRPWLFYAESESDVTKSAGFWKPVVKGDMIYISLEWRVHRYVRCGGHSFIKAFSDICGVRKRLGRFYGDLGFMGTCVKQEMGLTGVNGLGLMTYWFYHSLWYNYYFIMSPCLSPYIKAFWNICGV